MSEVFGDDFPDVFSTVLNDAEVAARRQVESATCQLVAILRNRTKAEHERAVRAEREVARLDAHLRTCEAARTNAEVRLAELEAAATRPGSDPPRCMTTRQIADADLVARVRYACCTGQAKAIRKASRLSVLVIGGAVGVHHSSVLRWESAAQLPTGRRALAYGQLLERLNGSPLEPLGGSL